MKTIRLFVLVDALGWITVERLGFLSRELPYRRKLGTVFGYSSTAIPSLLTGAPPDVHGHWFLFKKSINSPLREAKWLSKVPRLASSWRVRTWFQERWRRRLGIDGYFSLYNVPMKLLPQLEPVEMKDTWGCDAFPVPTLVDRLADSPLEYYVSDWRKTDAQKVSALKNYLQDNSPDVVLLYLTEVDAVQHSVGTQHQEFVSKVNEAGRVIKELQEILETRGKVETCVTSDHGMTDVTRHESLEECFQAHGLREGKDFDAFFDSTVARFWNIRDRRGLQGALNSLDWGQVLSSEQLKAWQVPFETGEYGDLYFLADPGVLILPSHMGTAPLAAMHGYDPADPTSDACFLSNFEPGLKEDHITAIHPALAERWGLD